MEENKDVMITIKSSQLIDGTESDGSELITQGKYYYRDGKILFSYMESDLTGLDGTQTMFLIKPGEVVLSRRGAVNSRMVFRPGENHRFSYETEYGVLHLGLDTRRLDCALDEHGGDMEIEYDLDFERSLYSRNAFKINVKEKELKS
ncbi:MAG: DUF1934 domain-containing protein [Oscillospiraceae bacterium]|nr:DUF1934 domain-containing protein [Oscillospiraceae bacterium]